MSSPIKQKPSVVSVYGQSIDLESKLDKKTAQKLVSLFEQDSGSQNKKLSKKLMSYLTAHSGKKISASLDIKNEFDSKQWSESPDVHNRIGTKLQAFLPHGTTLLAPAPPLPNRPSAAQNRQPQNVMLQRQNQTNRAVNPLASAADGYYPSTFILVEPNPPSGGSSGGSGGSGADGGGSGS